MKSGDVLEIIFDNPSSSESIAAMINSMGNELIEQNRSGGQVRLEDQERLRASKNLPQSTLSSQREAMGSVS